MKLDEMPAWAPEGNEWYSRSIEDEQYRYECKYGIGGNGRWSSYASIYRLGRMKKIGAGRIASSTVSHSDFRQFDNPEEAKLYAETEINRMLMELKP